MDTIPLRADCAQCDALCCVALAFDRSSLFAFDKPAAQPCPNLTACGSCAIHRDLASRGFGGCVRFDCLGAGQRVTQMFPGRSWREGGGIAHDMFEAFAIMRRVHELVLLLHEAAKLPMQPEQRAQCASLLDTLRQPDWMPQSLRAFTRSGVEREARNFLRSLRDCVRA
jgi:hypothetical protein